MKNLKKVLAFMLALALVFSSMTNVFADTNKADANKTMVDKAADKNATTASDDVVTKLANLKLLLNTTDEEVKAELTRSIGLAMVLKALGYTQADSDAQASKNTFVDMQLAQWAKGFATIGEELSITNGVSAEPKMFQPLGKLSKHHFVTFVLRALGYDVNEAWAKAAELADSAKLLNDKNLEEEHFTKGEAAAIIYNALKAKVQGDQQKRTLGQKLVDEGKLDKDLAIENGVIKAAPTALEVADVKADNLIEVVVTFNTPVEKASAEDTANYRVKGRAIQEAKLSDDGLSVVLTLKDALANKKAITLKVMNVKSVEGLKLEKVEKTFTPYDDIYPTVEDIKFTGPKTFDIIFSEPMQNTVNTSNVSLKLGSRTLAARVEKVSGKVASVRAYSSFKDGGEYTVLVGNPKRNDQYFRDYANYPNVFVEKVVTYSKNMDAPVVDLKLSNQKWIKISFDKPVTGVTAKHFYHTFASYGPVAVFSKKEDLMNALTNPNNVTNQVKKTDSVTDLYVLFCNKPKNSTQHALPAGDVKVVVLGKADDKSQIKDNWGNKFETTEIPVTIVPDREAPEVVDVEVVDNQTVKVTFNEEISNLNKATFELLNKEGKIIVASNRVKRTIGKEGKSVKLDFGNSYEGLTMVLSIKGVKDASLYENKLVDYTQEVFFSDKELKAPKKAEFYKNGKEYALIVTFGEDMSDSALEAKNYKIEMGDKTVNLDEDGDFYEGKSNIVKFPLFRNEEAGKADKSSAALKALTMAPEYKKFKTGATLLISQDVADLAGNKSKMFQQELSIGKMDMAAVDNVDKLYATDPHTIVVKFKNEMTTIDGTDFIVKSMAPKEFTYKVDSYDLDEANKKMTIHLPEEDILPTDLSGVTVEWKEGDTEDIFGRKLAAMTGQSVEDKVAPAIGAFVVTEDASPVSVLDAIKAGDGAVKYVATLTSDQKDAYKDLDGKKAATIVKNNDKYEAYILYSEPINLESLSNLTYELNGFTVEKAELADQKNVVKLTLMKDKNTTEEDIKDLMIKQVRPIQDASPANNELSSADVNVTVLN